MFYWLARVIKLLVAWIDLLVFSIFMWLVSWLPKAQLNKFYPKLYQRWNWCFVRALGVQLNVLQQNRYSLPDSYLVIANHPSAFEDVGIPAVFPVRALAKYEVRNWWFVGRIGRAANTIFVKREDKKSRRAAAEQIEQRLLGGDCIAVFPEGGCFGRRLKDRFHYGTFETSLNTGVPIVPVFIHYEAQQDFEWQGQTLMQKLWDIITATNKNVNFYIFDAIDPARFISREDYTAYVYSKYLKWQEKYLE